MKYRKKPLIIDAVRYNGHNSMEVYGQLGMTEIVELFEGGLEIKTKHGTVRANVGDWVIRGVMGEFYPCSPDAFDATYES